MRVNAPIQGIYESSTGVLEGIAQSDVPGRAFQPLPSGPQTTALLGGYVAISANVTINVANKEQYDGKTWVFTAAFTVTLATGLGNFSALCKCPPTGNASIARTAPVTLNDGTATITRTLGTQRTFGIFATADDAFEVT